MSRMHRILVCACVLALGTLAGCGGNGQTVEDGGGRDSGRLPDMGRDLGLTEDTGPEDTGPADEGPRDSGPPVDVGTDTGAEAGCTSNAMCDDRDSCTTDLCDTTNGACGFRRIAGCCTLDTQCDDGNPCTTDTCDSAATRCVRRAVAGCCSADTDCDDANVCTTDRCDLAMHRCAATVPVPDCCVDGATRDCYAGPTGTGGVGACRSGRQTCVANRYDGQPCTGEVLPSASESCDSAMVDENCNGAVNEGCACTAGMTRACYTGPAGTSGVGRCRPGSQSCSSGSWAACTAQTLPGTEVCGNGVDEDCNGSDLACPPVNDTRAMAIPLTLTHAETSVMGTTVNATHDGPAVTCGCTSGANVWYRFTLTANSAVYLDTASTTPGADTSLFLTTATGTLVPAQAGNGQPNAGLCNDDAGCGGVPGWGSTLQSRTWGFLPAAQYFVAVGGCGTGTFTLRVQHIPITEGSYFYNDRISGDTSDTTFLIGSNQHAGTCGGRISGEDVRWFVTCGAPQFFSVCEGDGGAYLSRNTTTETTRWDPILYLHSGITGVESVCGDTGATGVDCRGRIGSSIASSTFDTIQGGARLNNVPASRGLNAILVDERVRGSGMDYRLRYRLRDR